MSLIVVVVVCAACDGPLHLKHLASVVFNAAILVFNIVLVRATTTDQHVDDFKSALNVSSTRADVELVVVVGHAFCDAHEGRKVRVGGDDQSICRAFAGCHCVDVCVSCFILCVKRRAAEFSLHP